MSFLDRFFGSAYEKKLSRARAILPKVALFEDTLTPLSDEELKSASDVLRARAKDGESLDELLPYAYALVRESARRTLNERHYDVQIIGGILLHQGNIAEMRTGEGKTLVGTLPAYLNALSGEGVHVVTVNDYLARRDAVWMGQVYTLLGLTVGIINHDASYIYDPLHTEGDEARDREGSFRIHYEFLRPVTRKEAYQADITYATNNELGFDYLRDNIEYDKSALRQRRHAFAIIDEIDSILIDEARTPLIISAPARDSDQLYSQFSAIAERLVPESDFTIDEKLRAISLTNAGIEKAESMLGIKDIYTERGIKYVHHLETAVRARALYTKDKEYVVRDGNVVIVDEFTGRLQQGRRWSDGLHQAIEAKEGVPIQKESRTFASVTFQNYFRMYEKLSGMTGTALTSQEEFLTVYGLDVVPVPTHRPIKRNDQYDLIFQTEKGKYQAVITRLKELHESGQPVLIGTASIERNEALSVELAKAGVPHQMLNAKNHEREAEIIADAGKKGSVTLATNMAGRGVDIKLGGPFAQAEEREEVRRLGGLFVLGTERHEARRIDSQLRGRSGRQGDPGTTQFFVSMEDSLMRVFASDMVKRMMGRFGIPEDQPIENSLITRALESAQAKIEGFHFDSRKHVLAYDDIINKQRQAVYKERKALLFGDTEVLHQVRESLLSRYPHLDATIKEKELALGVELFHETLRRMTLQIKDALWVEHLELMDYTRSSVNLRAYGQRDPLIEYRKEAIRLFREMEEAQYSRMAELLPRITLTAVERTETEQKKIVSEVRLQGGAAGTDSKSAPSSGARVASPYGRNDTVTISNGTEKREMKYKKAEPLLALGWSIVTKE